MESSPLKNEAITAAETEKNAGAFDDFFEAECELDVVHCALVRRC